MDEIRRASPAQPPVGGLKDARGTEGAPRAHGEQGAVTAHSPPPPDVGAPAAASVPRPRDPTFDILKGISILEVMTHHVLSTSMRKFAELHDPMWWTMAVLSRILHFAVPTFLLVSAILLARSVASKPKPDWRRFFARRTERTLMPYLVWTGIYIAFRILWLRDPSDVTPTQLTLPMIGSVTTPELLTPSRIWINVFWGKAYYHIYFMVVLLQFSVLFPLLFAAMRRWRMGFAAALGLGASIQVAAFYVQRHLIPVPYPASTVLWYCMPVVAGMWVGLNWKEWDGVWRKWRWGIALLAVAGLAMYLPPALMMYLNKPISNELYHIGIKTYCLGIALLLLALSRTLGPIRLVGRFLQRVGDRSIAFFLIHPLVLFMLGGPKITRLLEYTVIPPLALGLTMFLITWTLSEASRLSRADRVLFGR